MPNTYTQLYTHFVFAVKSPQMKIKPEWNDDLQKYISGITKNLQCKMLAINNVADHIHLFVARHPAISEAEFAQRSKNNSSRWVNTRNWMRHPFYWQTGYGAFTYGHSQIDSVCKYIANQQNHHKKWTFRQEYINFLKKFGIDYDDQYLFDFFD